MNQVTLRLNCDPACLRGIAQRTGFQVSADELQAIQPLCSEFDRLEHMLNDYSRDAAAEQIRTLRDDFATNPSEENQKRLEESELNRDAHIADFRERTRLVRAAIKGLGPKSAAACEPILSRLRAEIVELADEHEERERGLCEDFKVKFSPSVPLNALRARAALIGSIIESSRASGGAHPKRALAGILEL